MRLRWILIFILLISIILIGIPIIISIINLKATPQLDPILPRPLPKFHYLPDNYKLY